MQVIEPQKAISHPLIAKTLDSPTSVSHDRCDPMIEGKYMRASTTECSTANHFEELSHAGKVFQGFLDRGLCVSLRGRVSSTSGMTRSRKRALHSTSGCDI